jgi:putative FmdB family regulatory protein
MPIYEYKCSKCGKVNEFLENFSGRQGRGRSCKYCGGKKLEKQMSIFAPQIKEGASKRCYGCGDRACPNAGR